MTIASEANRWAYTGDGANQDFQYTNKIFASTDLIVYVDGALQTEVTHYTVSGVGNGGGGTVSFVAAPAVGASACTSLGPQALQGATRIERLPFPGMSAAQVEVYAARRLALGGNERRRSALGEAKVTAARSKCVEEFWRLDDWWPVYVKLWRAAEGQPPVAD